VDRAAAVNALAGIRAVVGAVSWLTPRPAGKLFGIDSGRNPQAPYLARLFGARDVALAYGAATSEGGDQDRWLAVGLACDLADAAAGIAGHRGGYLDPLTSVLVTGTALVGATLGAVALSSSQQQPGSGAA
jgi:hypothetical protein